MKSLPDLKQEWITDYLAGDGLADGEPGRNRSPGINEAPFSTVPVDNGILFAVEAYWLLDRWALNEESDKRMFRRALVQTRAFKDTRGLFHRNPNRYERTNAHDNYVAMISGSILFDDYQHLNDIYNWGSEHKYMMLVYTYNNVHPDIIEKERWIQPADVFILKLALGLMPGLLSTFWFWAKMWHTSKYQMDRLKDGIHISSALLNWIRLKGLGRIKHRPWYLKPYFWLVKRRRARWIAELLKHTGGEGIQSVLRTYFPKGPLLHQLSRKIRY